MIHLKSWNGTTFNLKRRLVLFYGAGWVGKKLPDLTVWPSPEVRHG
jgi:hypothetical protein